MYYVQLFNKLINFRTIFIKPYFYFKAIYNNKPNELNELKTPLPTLKLTLKPIKPIKPIILPFIKYS